MAKKLERITREEFDRRLDAYNERRMKELQAEEAEQERISQLLTQYEHKLNELEAGLNRR